MQERVTNHQQERRWTSPALKVEKVLVGPCLDYMRMSPLVGKVSTSPDLTGRGNAAESLSAWENFRDSHGHWCPCAWEHDVVWLNITELPNSLLNHTRETLLVQAMHRRQVLPALGPGAWITPEVWVLGSKRQERTCTDTLGKYVKLQIFLICWDFSCSNSNTSGLSVRLWRARKRLVTVLQDSHQS